MSPINQTLFLQITKIRVFEAKNMIPIRDAKIINFLITKHRYVINMSLIIMAYALIVLSV